MTAIDRAKLDAALIAAHEEGDIAALSSLYAEAAKAMDSTGDSDAACFFFTQAYVFALEAGLPQARTLRATLKAKGRL